MAQTNANLIWKIADLLRGPYQPNQYGDVILPFTILRRLDCILEPTKDDVLAEYKKIASTKVDPGVLLKAKFKLPFYNISRWSFASLIGDPEGVADNLVDYIEHFSPNVVSGDAGSRSKGWVASTKLQGSGHPRRSETLLTPG
jgi:type I restriction enzyme M protein